MKFEIKMQNVYCFVSRKSFSKHILLARFRLLKTFNQTIKKLYTERNFLLFSFQCFGERDLE